MCLRLFALYLMVRLIAVTVAAAVTVTMGKFPLAVHDGANYLSRVTSKIGGVQHRETIPPAQEESIFYHKAKSQLQYLQHIRPIGC